MAAPLVRTSTPGVYARGSRWVAVYLEGGRQRRRSAPTFRAAREIKTRATAKEAALRAGRNLHGYALAYFAPEERLRDLDEQRVRGFVDWLCRRQGPDRHRLCDRSVHNAVLPVRACLRHAHGAGVVVADVGAAIVLSRPGAGARMS